jgi:hypothetical protein
MLVLNKAPCPEEEKVKGIYTAMHSEPRCYLTAKWSILFVGHINTWEINK